MLKKRSRLHLDLHAIDIQISMIRKGRAKKIRDCLVACGDPKDRNLSGEVDCSKSGNSQTFLAQSPTARFYLYLILCVP
jgi:hypothetical protein